MKRRKAIAPVSAVARPHHLRVRIGKALLMPRLELLPFLLRQLRPHRPQRRPPPFPALQLRGEPATAVVVLAVLGVLRGVHLLHPRHDRRASRSSRASSATIRPWLIALWRDLLA